MIPDGDHMATADQMETEKPNELSDNEFSRLIDLYKHFPAINSINQEIKKRVRTMMRTSPERAEKVEALQKEIDQLERQLQGAVTMLQRSLENQKKYNLVDKRWMRQPNFVKHALESGRLSMELDLRIDKDGNFWISHALGAKRSFLPPFIDALSTEEMRQESDRFSLEEALEIFEQYKGRGHRLILEIKTLGGDQENFGAAAQNLKSVLERTDTLSSIAIASLSPKLLVEIHKAMPEIPLILNGGIVPMISYDSTGKKMVDRLVSPKSKWQAVGIQHFGEVVFSTSDEVVQRVDGQSIHTGYVLTHIPKDLLKIFQTQAKQKNKAGGRVSLSAVTTAASILDIFGMKEKAKKLRKKYADSMQQEGVRVMATTWGQSMDKIPGFKNLNAQTQVETLREVFGDVLFYTNAPELWAHLLPEIELIEEATGLF